MARNKGFRRWETPDGIKIIAEARYCSYGRKIVVEQFTGDFEHKKMAQILVDKEDYKQIYDNEMNTNRE